jgi:holin-like protein
MDREDPQTRIATPSEPPRRWVHEPFLTLCQTVFFVAVWVAADYCVRRAGVKAPGSVVGMALILVLLFAGILKTRHVRYGAEFLLAEMLLFFTPAFVAGMTYFGLFATQGLRLLGAVGLGTLTVMAGTVLVVDRVFRWESKRNAATGLADE